MTGCKNTVIPEDVKYINDYAFDECEGLEKINLPEGLKIIGQRAFRKCINLKNIEFPESLTIIGEDAFEGCVGLTNLNIPKNTDVFFGNPFTNCSGLMSITVDPENKKYDSRDNSNAIVETETDTLMLGCVNTKIPSDIKTIGDAFYGCSGLKEIELPSGLTTIGVYAFRNCINLQKINIPDGVTDISGAFEGCSSLKEVNIPDSVTDVSGAFARCSSLKEVNIPDSVTDINGAFEGCSSLREINIPDGVTYMGRYTFKNCESLMSIKIPDGITKIDWGLFEGCSSLTVIDIPDGVTSINNDAFRGCSSLKSIQLPDSVKGIGSDVFRGCSSLESLEIPPLVKDLYGSFEGCVNLKIIYIPRSVTWIYAGTFGGNAKVMCWMGSEAENYAKKYNIPYELLKTPEEKKFTLSDDGNGGADISGYEPADGDTGIDIPEQINGVAITGIAEDAFKDCSQVESINISGNISSISGNPFKYCSKLKQITVDPDNSTYDSRDNCNAVIEKSSNKLVAGISGTVIPDSVEIIGESAFEGCIDISSITIPDSVTDIEKAAFKDCRNLTGIQLPETLKSVGEEAFMGCENIKSVSVPDSVESIGDRAFGYADDNTVYSDFIMICGRDSAARRYADNNNITVKTEDETEKPTETSTEEPTEKQTQESTEEPTEKPTQEPTEPSTEEDTYQILGTLVGTWNMGEGTFMTQSKDDANVYTATIPGVAAGEYEYQVVKNGSWQTKFCGSKGFTDDASFGNLKCSVKETCDVVVTLNLKDMTLKTSLDEETPTQKDMSAATVTLKKAKTTYNGKAQNPEVASVVLGAYTLAAGTDYEVEAVTAKEPGTYTVKVNGTGNYKGTATAEYTITKRDISKAAATVKAKTYTGKKLTSSGYTVKMKLNGKTTTLKKGTDYTVKAASRTSVGSSTVTITGKGNFKGTLKAKFAVTAKKISATKVTVPSEAVYTGKTVKVKVAVKDGSKKLDSRSYKVSYRNNRKIGKATVIITGRGNYTGTVRKTFRIVPNKKKQ